MRIILFFLFTNLLFGQEIIFNEVLSSSSSFIDEDGDSSDWIELYNSSDNSVNLGNYYLSDDENNITKWKFPNITINPNSYILIYCSGKNKSNNELHTNFKISSAGESIYLNNSTTNLTKITVPKLNSDISYGKSIINNNYVYYSSPTPNEKNSESEFFGIIQSVVEFSDNGGVLNNSINLELSGNSSEEKIIFTTDTYDPSDNSNLYENSLNISENTVIRAKIIRDNYIPSDTETRTYIFNNDYNLPLISLVSNNDNLFDEKDGIYVKGENAESNWPYYGSNFWKDIEIPVHFSYYDQNGSLSVNLNAGLKIFGGTSRSNEQRSFSVHKRNKYSSKKIKYPFFKNFEYDEFESLILRNAANDWLKANLRDAAFSQAMFESGLDYQDYQSVKVYLNGKYWGLYHLREKHNEHMLASKHRINANNITRLEHVGALMEGDEKYYNEWKELIKFYEENDLSDESNFEYIDEKIDLENFAMYNITNIFIGNQDWPGNNRKFWIHPDGKWRWILFDTDFGFGIEQDYNYNMLTHATAENSSSYRNPPWSTILLRKLLQNSNFKDYFINRFSDELNSRFLPSELKNIFNTFHSNIESEIKPHYQRWGKNPSRAKENLDIILEYIDKRPNVMRQHIIDYFNINDYHNLNVKIVNPEYGSILINNNLEIKDAEWSGFYFENLEIDLKAKPKAGFEFSHWSIDYDSDDSNIKLSLKSNTVIKAINHKSSSEKDFGDWIEIYNPNIESISLNNWYFKDELDEHKFIFSNIDIPAEGYLVVTNDSTELSKINLKDKVLVGNFNFGLGKKDKIRLYDNKDILIDFVEYNINETWPDCSNGTGFTLELKDHFSDNNNGQNWTCINKYGSPFRKNNPIIYNLPPDNFRVEVGSATCIGNSDGVINLSVEDASYDYTVTITGKDNVTITGDAKTASVTGLAKGTYTVCFSVDGQDDYEQCFEVNVTEPPALSAFIDIDTDDRRASIVMSGSSRYNIEINGKKTTVGSDSFETSLSTGLNIIKVYTDLECQGYVEREVFISEYIHYYPNPTENDVNVYVGGKDTKVKVSVFNASGALIYTKEQMIEDISRKTAIDLSRQIQGTYIVVMESETVRQTFKIIRE
jgi:hypothetical protein